MGQMLQLCSIGLLPTNIHQESGLLSVVICRVQAGLLEHCELLCDL